MAWKRFRKKRELPSGLWVKCPNCGAMLFKKELVRNRHVCGECDYNFAVSALERVKMLADDLAQRRSGDLFSIVRTSSAAEPDMWAERVGPDFGRKAGQRLKELEVGDGTPSLGKAFARTVKRAFNRVNRGVCQRSAPIGSMAVGLFCCGNRLNREDHFFPSLRAFQALLRREDQAPPYD